ncbi:protein with unknown function [Dorcoceras hygrometricum]|uniref:Uncharacterized protein n=1 Tax=Dorcoceras hygrometricum TaxID=472368 RepID=A0A2Z7BD59_9LAMI|nr:protein with unknown function [Dorcoceras hygrometricum]
MLDVIVAIGSSSESNLRRKRESARATETNKEQQGFELMSYFLQWERRRISAVRIILRKEDKQLHLSSRWFDKIKFSSWFGAFLELAAGLAMETSKVKTVVRNQAHTVEAGVHLWSLGVLTAAGCGIGSVHEVVRSNLLVDPSEVEEGEM